MDTSLFPGQYKLQTASVQLTSWLVSDVKVFRLLLFINDGSHL